ncbi:MAG: DUF2339 domain-containing protein [Pirellulaceae bacterium]
MAFLIFLLVLALLAGPILGVIALVQLSTLRTRMADLKRDIESLAMPRPVAAPQNVASPDPVSSVKAALSKIEPVTTVAAPVNVARAKTVPVVSESVAPRADPAKSERATPKRDVESALASRWFVWVGGAAVALGGLLFVKYAHDHGLIPPIFRVIIGLMSAVSLVAAGEWLRKRGDALAASYVPSALSAAGLTIGFGVVYAAYALYDILSPSICFPLLVGIGLAALWLSRRQGPFIAALGLIGSYAAPALVPSEQPSAIGFFAYLIVIVAASLFELRHRPWWWLGYAAVIGATGWALLWIHGDLFLASHIVPTGVFALLMGAMATTIPAGRAILTAPKGTLADPTALAPTMRVAIAGITAASLVLASLVWSSQHSAAALLLFAMGMIAIAGFGWMRDGLVAAPIAAALTAFVVLMLWPDVGTYRLTMDARGWWSTIPGEFEPFRFRNAMLIGLAGFTLLGAIGVFNRVEKRPWAALAAGASFLFLFGTWTRADSVLTVNHWVMLAALLSVLLAVIADRIKDRSAQILLVGTALLSLFAIDRAYDGVWQTMAIAILATAFALATRRLPLPWLGAIAAAIASFAAIRLFVGREFWGEPAGLVLGAHWVLYGYGLPAILFWTSSRWLKETQFARYRTALEGLALGLAISLVSLELRVLIGGGITGQDMSLLEMSAHALAWLGAAYGLAYRQTLFSSFVSRSGAWILLAASCIVFFVGLTIRNPVGTQAMIEGGMIVNSLWLAYLAPAVLLSLMARKLDVLGLQKLRDALGVFILALLITFVTLQVKHLFQGPVLNGSFATEAESYSVSAAWVALAVAIFIAGIRLQRQAIRFGGLAILALAILKVFAFDLFELGGLWRIASIIGLGLCLIGVGWLYTRFVHRPASSA